MKKVAKLEPVKAASTLWLFPLLASSLLSLILLAFLANPAQAQPSACGDSNGDGVINLGDLALDMNYLLESGVPPVSFDTADFDGLKFLSINDAQKLLTCIFFCGGTSSGICAPSGPALSPVIDPAVELRYPGRVPTGVSTFDLTLTLVNAPRYEAFVAPLSINVNGAPALIDSITFPVPGSAFETTSIPASSIDGPGIARLGLITFFVPDPAQLDISAIVHLSVPVSTEQAAVEVNWVTLSPIQAPTPDSSVYPLFLTNQSDQPTFPTLVGSCCLVPGDANDDGLHNIADVTHLIARIFTGGPAPFCASSSDANGDGTTNIADVTYSVARIFTGGPAPICGP